MLLKSHRNMWIGFWWIERGNGADGWQALEYQHLTADGVSVKSHCKREVFLRWDGHHWGSFVFQLIDLWITYDIRKHNLFDKEYSLDIKESDLKNSDKSNFIISIHNMNSLTLRFIIRLNQTYTVVFIPVIDSTCQQDFSFRIKRNNYNITNEADWQVYLSV